MTAFEQFCWKSVWLSGFVINAKNKPIEADCSLLEKQIILLLFEEKNGVTFCVALWQHIFSGPGLWFIKIIDTSQTFDEHRLLFSNQWCGMMPLVDVGLSKANPEWASSSRRILGSGTMAAEYIKQSICPHQNQFDSPVMHCVSAVRRVICVFQKGRTEKKHYAGAYRSQIKYIFSLRACCALRRLRFYTFEPHFVLQQSWLRGEHDQHLLLLYIHNMCVDRFLPFPIYVSVHTQHTSNNTIQYPVCCWTEFIMFP